MFVTHGLLLSIKKRQWFRFVSEEFEDNKDNNIEHDKSTPCRHKLIEEVERQNKFFKCHTHCAQ